MTAMPDNRKIPDEVRSRLIAAYGPRFLHTRRSGFDTERRGAIVEERVLASSVGDLTVRAATPESPSPVIEGHATTWTSYDMFRGPDNGGWIEEIVRGATIKTIGESRTIPLLNEHDGLPLATTGAGTLDLAEDDTGLRVTARTDPDSVYSQEVVSRIGRREIDRMSFAFRVIRQDWLEDFTRRIIREVQLFDVSTVVLPANPTTDVGLRADPSPNAATGPTADQIRARVQVLRATVPRVG